MTQRILIQKIVRRCRAARCAALAVLSLALLAGGCGPAGQGQDSATYPSQIEELAVGDHRSDPLVESQVRGRQVYMRYCQICHGATGQGNGFNSTNLAVTPRDFSDPKFWKSISDERLTSAISTGGTSVGKSVLMPAWGRTLSEKQIQDVIAYLRTVPEQVRQDEQAKEHDSEPAD